MAPSYTITVGEVVAIWLKRAHGAPMECVDSAELIAGRGLRGNIDQGGWRQVTMIDEAAWGDAVRELGIDVDPGARRANLLLRGVDLRNSRGKTLHIGKTVIELRGETRPCSLMDDAEPGLREALKPDWRAGAFGVIVRGGTIRVGDSVSG